MNKLVEAYMHTLASGDLEPVLLDTPEDAILDLDARLTRLEEQVNRIALNTLAMAQHLKALNDKVTAPPQSGIILPDRYN